LTAVRADPEKRKARKPEYAGGNAEAGYRSTEQVRGRCKSTSAGDL